MAVCNRTTLISSGCSAAYEREILP